ncbi:uncharacterized protein [Typha angustifolia]|uniref:uncharacterized protein isoform X1 n=1 Tax=Typha angustifolia TaxID=59011 RepID=UPI003C2B25FD
MAGTNSSPPSTISIGNCKVEIQGKDLICESDEKNLLISFQNDAKIRISVHDFRGYAAKKSYNDLQSLERTGQEFLPVEDNPFFLLNPKDVDSRSKLLLQEVLKLYMQELPTMAYAANTGKSSRFLERCISNGKYRTLILRSDPKEGLGEVIAAISYQIIPTDTQYAEIPLAAVSPEHQNKGIGQSLYEELSRRLQSVGVLTIFCWADNVSEGFWLKQGFVSVGEVDSKGKVRRLPIKAEIRKVLCFPGGSTLMISHLKRNLIHTSQQVRLQSWKFDSKQPSSNPSRTPGLVEATTIDTPESIPPSAAPLACSENIFAQNNMCHKINGNLELTGNGCDPDGGKCSLSGQPLKKRIWEASSSSLKSKRVRGGQLVDCCNELNPNLACDNCSLGTAMWKYSVNAVPKDSITPSSLGTHAEGKRLGGTDAYPVLEGTCPKIMFMNIADDAKKTCLTKIVEKLGGSVTCEGSASTHVVTGKARKTMNFCIALCSGAWVVSPNWLKASFREGMFVGESEYILKDEEYLMKYKCELRDAVIRAKADPCSLFRGYSVFLAQHIQPSFGVLSVIIKSAGGNSFQVIRRLPDSEEPSRTIFVACEEDIGDALAAARRGIRTFSSDWLMNCIMKQELDLQSPQFAESL